jgi:hypothetical protein
MITEEEWQAFMDDLQQTFSKFDVAQPEQEELRAIVESTKEAIVVSSVEEGSAGDRARRPDRRTAQSAALRSRGLRRLEWQDHGTATRPARPPVQP